MIIHARIDERLIHGQVATVWTNYTGTNRIVVVNSETVKDDVQIAALKMARPAGVKLAINSVEKGIINLTNPEKFVDEKIFLLTKNVQDMKTLIDNGVPIKKFNIGNISKKEGSRSIKKSVALTEEDIKDLKELLEKGIEITAQMLPTESDNSISTFID